MNRFIDINPYRCTACGTCMLACSDAHRSVGLQAHPRLSLSQSFSVSAVTCCHHCEGAICALVCPVHAITHESDYIAINEQTCIGCKMCALACPFGAITAAGTDITGVAGIKYETPTYSEALKNPLVWELGIKSVAVKCDLCVFDPLGPNCVRVCPTQALRVVDENDLNREVRQRGINAAVSSAISQSSCFDKGEEGAC